jgi:hypothetical protein
MQATTADNAINAIFTVLNLHGVSLHLSPMGVRLPDTPDPFHGMF